MPHAQLALPSMMLYGVNIAIPHQFIAQYIRQHIRTNTVRRFSREISVDNSRYLVLQCVYGGRVVWLNQLLYGARSRHSKFHNPPPNPPLSLLMLAAINTFISTHSPLLSYPFPSIYLSSTTPELSPNHVLLKSSRYLDRRA